MDRSTYHANHDEADWRVTLADTGQDAMTGARVRKIQKISCDDGQFMLTYGDGVGDVDIEKLLAFHQSHGKVLTVTGVRPPGRFGELMAGAGGSGHRVQREAAGDGRPHLRRVFRLPARDLRLSRRA